MFRVLSLPMRNWNEYSPVFLSSISMPFWVYLWGIEMSICYCYCCNAWNVLSLPMRNWNAGLTISFSACSKPFWVYLWGIEIIILKTSPIMPSIRFESTYEELKFISGKPVVPYIPRFESTYEELKSSPPFLWGRHIHRFESTYEELKLLFNPFQLVSWYLCFESTYEELKFPSLGDSSSSPLGFESTYEELKSILSWHG